MQRRDGAYVDRLIHVEDLSCQVGGRPQRGFVDVAKEDMKMGVKGEMRLL